MPTTGADLVALAAMVGAVASGVILYLVGRWLDPSRARRRRPWDE